MMAYSLQIIPDVTVDRPFYYTIVKTVHNEQSGRVDVIPLFTGHVVDL
uniref:Venom protein n=1 Tax=Ampulex compressa TaxID=860918 RepID=A0A1W6EW76_AMPCP|nr:venom protein [Ampulex compressa]